MFQVLVLHATATHTETVTERCFSNCHGSPKLPQRNPNTHRMSLDREEAEGVAPVLQGCRHAAAMLGGLKSHKHMPTLLPFSF